MTEQFYDRVTRKFGRFEGVPHPLAIYPQGNPEALFEQQLVDVSGQEKVALDLGCGDGQFTLRMAAFFREVVGIDSSVERLKLARAEQPEQARDQVRFEQQDASQTTFEDHSFDVIYGRRGPTPYQECARLTKQEGYFLTINIGEHDAWDLKETFGRGQGFGKWKTSALAQAEQGLRAAGFALVARYDVRYDE